MRATTDRAKRILGFMGYHVANLEKDITDTLRDEVNAELVKPFLTKMERALADLGETYGIKS